MAQSVVKLTLESNQYESNLRNAQKQLNEFTSKVGINMKALSGMAVAAGAVTTAMKVMKDAFFASETALDEWGRTVESAKSLYSGFLSALNNSDISGFLSRMDDIVSAARSAYDAMDELGTYSAFNQRNVAKGRAGYAEALDAYKLNPTAANKQALDAANQKVLQDLRDSHKKTENAYQEVLRNIATSRLSSKELQNEFVKTFSEGNYEDLASAKSSYKSGRGLNAGAQYYRGDRVYDGRIQDQFTGKWRDMSDFEKQQFEFARALSQVNDSQIKEVQALGAQSVAIQEQIANQNRQYNRLAGNNASKTGAAGGKSVSTAISGAPTYAADSIAAQEAEVARLTKLWKEAGAAVRDEYLAELNSAKAVLDTMKGGGSNKLGPMGEIQSGLNIGNILGKPNFPDKLDLKVHIPEKESGIKQFQEMTKDMNQMVGGIGSIASGIEQLGIELPSGLRNLLSGLNGIMSILSGITSILTVIEGTSMIPLYAGGGIAHAANGLFVPGHSYSGDRVPAMLNSGELILNKAQQGNLASQLNGGLQNLSLSAKVHGRDLVLAINNETMASGSGKIVFSKR